MAVTMVGTITHNVVGNLREEYGSFTTDADTGDIKTRIYNLLSVEFHPIGSTSVNQYDIRAFMNEDDTTESNDVMGQFHFASADTDPTYIYKAVGRGG